MASPNTLKKQFKDLKTGKELFNPQFIIIKEGNLKEKFPADLTGRKRKATVGAFGSGTRTIPPSYDFRNPHKRLKGTWVD